MSQTVPTGPGWWWVERPGGQKQVLEVVDADGCGGLAARRNGLNYSLRSFRWLAPVASVEEVERLRAKVGRLTGWLLRIDGGDSPTDDAEQLRRWAYEALTLGQVPS